MEGYLSEITSVRGGTLPKGQHLYEERLQRALKKAVADAGIVKQISAHTLRHSFATHLLQACTGIRTVQEFLGHSDVSTTMIYTYVLKVQAGGTASPLGAIPARRRLLWAGLGAASCWLIFF